MVQACGAKQPQYYDRTRATGMATDQALERSINRQCICPTSKAKGNAQGSGKSKAHSLSSLSGRRAARASSGAGPGAAQAGAGQPAYYTSACNYTGRVCACGNPNLHPTHSVQRCRLQRPGGPKPNIQHNFLNPPFTPCHLPRAGAPACALCGPADYNQTVCRLSLVNSAAPPWQAGVRGGDAGGRSAPAGRPAPERCRRGSYRAAAGRAGPALTFSSARMAPSAHPCPGVAGGGPSAPFPWLS